MLRYTGKHKTELERYWKHLFDALSINEDEDVFARFIQEELKEWRPEGIDVTWEYNPLDDDLFIFPEDEITKLNCPAKKILQGF